MPHGFTRTVYDDGYKYTMVYPPGWKYGDPRQPKVRKEPCVPGPSNPSIAGNHFFEPLEYSGLTDRQPVSAGSGARQGSTEGAQHAQNTVRSHSLRAYLAQAWLPKYVLGARVNQSVRYKWPFLPVLMRPPRARKLYLVQRIFDRDLRRAIVSLKEALGDRRLISTLAEQGEYADLTLPDTACCMLDETDAEFFDSCRLNAPSDVTKLLQAYPLRTVIKIINIFLGIANDEVCERLKFNDVNHLCPVRNAGLFDLIALPGSQPDELSLLIMAVSPLDFKNDDLEEFVRVGVPDGNLNQIGASPSPSVILWTVIWDMCLKYNCRYFVLTTYDEWVFGNLSADMHCASVTTHLRAPVFPGHMSVSARDLVRPCFPVPNVFESLFLWIFAAEDDQPDHILWPLPPDMPAPIKPSELSSLDGGLISLETGL
ncbi:hypothetical protein OG21DRAFT_378052 [Imleria badia]|nr:hypothetical protein OG21DRAFT_378052 [Imleria badia]